MLVIPLQPDWSKIPSSAGMNEKRNPLKSSPPEADKYPEAGIQYLFAIGTTIYRNLT